MKGFKIKILIIGVNDFNAKTRLDLHSDICKSAGQGQPGRIFNKLEEIHIRRAFSGGYFFK